MNEFLFVWSSVELILNIVSMWVHVREGAWGESESVVWSKKGSHKCLSLWFVDFSSSVVIVFSPEVIEVSGNVGINFISLNNVESSNNISCPLWSWWFWKFPDSGSWSNWVSFFDSVSLENIVHNIILISSIALVGEMVGITCIRSLCWWCPWGLLLDSDWLSWG